jgi:hypothetical protein
MATQEDCAHNAVFVNMRRTLSNLIESSPSIEILPGVVKRRFLTTNHLESHFVYLVGAVLLEYHSGCLGAPRARTPNP